MRILFLLLLAGSLQAQPFTDPAGAGMSARRLARIDSVIGQYVSNHWLNGAVAIVYRNGKLAYYKEIGYNDAERKQVMTTHRIFRIASQTKAITSAAIMMLVEEGRLLPDDEVAKFIPEFNKQKVLQTFHDADSSFTTVPANRNITIRDLLSHTSGIGYAQIGSPVANAIYAKAGVPAGITTQPITLGEKMKLLGSLPLFHQPGEKWTYGLNTDLLGYIVEIVSGMPLDTFFITRIFAPLGMTDTYFYLPGQKYGRLAELYSSDSTGRAIKMADHLTLNGDLPRNFPNSRGTYFSGGAGLSSTAHDYAAFMQMLLNQGTYNGKRLLSASSVRMMTSSQIGALGLSHGNKFGLGFEIITPESSAFTPESAGSFGWGGMFGSSYWIDPKEKIVAQLFINIFPFAHGDLAGKFRELVYQAIDQ